MSDIKCCLSPRKAGRIIVILEREKKYWKKVPQNLLSRGFRVDIL